MIIDSHCHLEKINLAPFDNNLELALQDFIDYGVKHFISIGINHQNNIQIFDYAQRFESVECALGNHPCNITSLDFSWLEQMLKESLNGVIAIGEIGLDYFHSIENKINQQKAFSYQIELANRFDLPVIIHSRNAASDTIAILKEVKVKNLGVVHCFTYDKEIAKKILDLGFNISFSGIVTFKNAKELQDVAKFIPKDRLLLETDSPYLTPVPFRGKDNYPKYTIHVFQFLSDLFYFNLDELINQTYQNYLKLFKNSRLHNEQFKN